MLNRCPWSLSYYDGSGNRYHFWQASEDVDACFEYSPIVPSVSSSGLYSGGKPERRTVNEEQLESLWHWVDRLASNESLHSAQRTKGSGMFRLATSASERRFIIRNGSMLRKFGDFVESFRSE